MNIPGEVNRILHEKFEIDPDRLVPDVDLYQDLGLDSLDGADLLALLEARMGQTIMPEKIMRARSLQDIYDIVATLTGSSEFEGTAGGNAHVEAQPPDAQTTATDH